MTNKTTTKKIYIGKVSDEPNEWVIGELLDGNRIKQKQMFPWSKCCGIGIFAVEKDSIEEVEL